MLENSNDHYSQGFTTFFPDRENCRGFCNRLNYNQNYHFNVSHLNMPAHQFCDFGATVIFIGSRL